MPAEFSSPSRALRRALMLAPLAGLGGCLVLPVGGRSGPSEPLRIQVLGFEPLPPEGGRWRFAARVRLDNPGSPALEHQGLSLELLFQDRVFARGRLDAPGSVPARGERVLLVPLAVEAGDPARAEIARLQGPDAAQPVEMKGRGELHLGGWLGGDRRFELRMRLRLPRAPR